MKNISYSTVTYIMMNDECAKLFRNFSDMNEDDKLKNICWKCWKITLRYVNSLWEKRKVHKGWIHCMICIICYDIECMCGYTMPYMYLIYTQQ